MHQIQVTDWSEAPFIEWRIQEQQYEGKEDDLCLRILLIEDFQEKVAYMDLSS